MLSEQALLGGRYELREALGRGGMATVRRGFDTRLGRPVAVKQLVPTLAADPVCQARFQREARSSARLSHPAIVAVFDTGAQSDPDTEVSIPYLVMELVDGQTLRELLRSGGKVAPERALELTRDVLEALGHSHEAGIVHRDIKPANVMVTATGAVKVMDFGIARAVAETSTDFTQTASVVGTAHYLSPEQARGEKVGFSSDLYSAGCLLYELLTGRPPFVGESVLSVIYQHVREAPVPPSELDPEVGPEVDAVVLKALAKDPADRYGSARDMRTDIDRVLAGHQPAAAAVPVPVAATPASVASAGLADDVAEDTAHLGGAGRRRRRGGLALGAALVALVMMLGGYGLYRTFTPQAAADQLVQIPDLVGRSQAQAEQALRDAHLTAQLHLVRGSAGVTLHTVLRQSPSAGRDVSPGSAVSMDVNNGPASAMVPSGLVGRDVAAVKRDLAAAGFTRLKMVEADSQPANVSEGQVLAVNPGEGQVVSLTHRILLTVAGAQVAESSAPSSASRRQPSTSKAHRRSSSSQPTSEPKEDRSAPTSAASEPTERRTPSSGTGPSKTSDPQPSTAPTSSAATPVKPAEPRSSTSKAPESKPSKSKPPKVKPSKGKESTSSATDPVVNPGSTDESKKG